MPVFNGEAYVRQAIESLLQQSLYEFELLIYNDGSADQSEQVIAACTDARIRYFRNERNLGVGATTNQGIDQARGEYIALMDCDDVSLPQRLEKQVVFMDAHPEVGVCGTGSQFLGTDQVKIFPEDDTTLRRHMLGYFPFRNPTLMFRRNMLVASGVRYRTDREKAYDYEFVADCLPHCQVYNLPDVLLHYRLHAQQETQQYREAYLRAAERVSLKQLRFLHIKPSAEEEALHVAILNATCCRNPAEATASDQWLTKLKKGNQETGFYAEPDFSRFVDSFNFRIRKFRDADQFNLALLKEYFFSNYRHFNVLSKLLGWRHVLLFIGKCFLQWKRRDQKR